MGAVLCLMGHLQKASGDSKRAVDAYIEALRVNPYLWEAFDGLIELGIPLPRVSSLLIAAGVSLRVENCFKATSTMRALRESTHTTNIDAHSSIVGGSTFSLAEIPDPRSTSTTAFQPIFNWDKSQPTFSSRFNQPLTPAYVIQMSCS